MGEKAGRALVPVQERVAELQEKKHQGVLQSGERVGALKMNRFHARFAKYMELHSLVVALENGVHETYGMDQKTFCKEFAGVSYDTTNNFRNLCKEAKAEVITAIKVLGYTNNTIELLKTSDDEEVKALMSKGTLVVGSEEIPVTPENMPKVIKHIEKVVKRNNDLEAEKEELGKKLESKYDMADRNKKLEEKNKRLEKEKEVLGRKYEQSKKGLSEEDIVSLNAIQSHKDQFDTIMALMEMTNVQDHSSKTRTEFIIFAEYMHDRACLMFDHVKNTQDLRDPVPDAQLDEDREFFIKKYGKDALA